MHCVPVNQASQLNEAICVFVWQSSPFNTHNKENTFRKLEKKKCSSHRFVQLLGKRKWKKYSKQQTKKLCVVRCYLKTKTQAKNYFCCEKKNSRVWKIYEMSIYLIICFLFVYIVACRRSVFGCLYDFDDFFTLSSGASEAYSTEKFIEIPFISIYIRALLMLCSKSFGCTLFNTFDNLNS